MEAALRVALAPFKAIAILSTRERLVMPSELTAQP